MAVQLDWVQLATNLAGSMSKIMKALSKSLLATFGPIAALGLLLEPISAILEGIMEPINMLTPLFTAWGYILGQLLYPVMGPIVEILMAFTPLLIAIVNMLLPVLNLLIPIVNILLPAINVVVGILTAFVNVLGLLSEGWNGLLNIGLNFTAKLSEAWNNIFNRALDAFNAWIAIIRSGVSDWWNGVVTWIKNLWQNFIKGGFDSNPDTWW